MSAITAALSKGNPAERAVALHDSARGMDVDDIYAEVLALLKLGTLRRDAATDLIGALDRLTHCPPDLSALEADVTKLTKELAAAHGRNDSPGVRAELARLRNEIVALNARTQTLRAEIAMQRTALAELVAVEDA